MQELDIVSNLLQGQSSKSLLISIDFVTTHPTKFFEDNESEVSAPKSKK